ncbi:ABC transporter substrate-binding protein [Rhodococcus sp. NPDC057014]|uniref:ABC transporter substrate-binding protein n=1 Tax=Rhodococcus sp. NPDC057014 TaxID=3346000 RepID=UPI003631205D
MRSTQTLPRGRRNAHRSILTAATVALSLALTACGGAGAGQVTEAGPPVMVNDTDWNTLVDAAKNEGQVVVYSSLSGVEASFAKFEEAYPGISVTVERAPTSDLITRLDQEAAVNAQGADVTMHSQTGWFEASNEENRFAALKVGPEQAAAGWEDHLDGKSYPFVFSNAYIVGYNTKSGRPVKNMNEFLDAAAHSKIGIIDAEISTAQSFLYSLWQDAYGDDFMKRLSDLDITVYNSNVPLAQGLAAGEIDYGIGLAPSTVLGLKEEGAPVDYIVPDEATSGVPYHAAALSNAPHPNAAQLFTNWLMSEAGAAQFVAHHAPASTPVATTGSIPWGQIPTPEGSGWTQQDHEDFITSEWTPLYG